MTYVRRVRSSVCLGCVPPNTSLSVLKDESCVVGAGRLLASSFVAHGTSHLFKKPDIRIRNRAEGKQADEAFPEMLQRRFA